MHSTATVGMWAVWYLQFRGQLELPVALVIVLEGAYLAQCLMHLDASAHMEYVSGALNQPWVGHADPAARCAGALLYRATHHYKRDNACHQRCRDFYGPVPVPRALSSTQVVASSAIIKEQGTDGRQHSLIGYSWLNGLLLSATAQAAARPVQKCHVNPIQCIYGLGCIGGRQQVHCHRVGCSIQCLGTCTKYCTPEHQRGACR